MSTQTPAKVVEPITRIGEKQRPRWLAVSLLLAAAVLFTFLGRWQMHRAEEQKVLEQQIAAAGNLPSLDLNRKGVDEAGVYRKAIAEGIYDPGQQFYLDGRSYDGKSGYHVITALRLEGSREYVLVNRGWIPGNMEFSPVPPGRVRVEGVLMKPQLPALRLGNPTGFTRPYLDPNEYARESGRAVAPLFLVAASGGPEIVPIKNTYQSKQGMHEAYAVQWFAFAAFAVISAAGILMRRWRRG